VTLDDLEHLSTAARRHLEPLLDLPPDERRRHARTRLEQRRRDHHRHAAAVLERDGVHLHPVDLMADDELALGLTIIGAL
jgi:hypothetical protein